MTETLASTLYTISSLFSLILIGFLWWVVYRFPSARRLWGLLATGWTLNLGSSIFWGLYVMLVGDDVPGLVDTLYIARYVFVGLAFLVYPALLSVQRIGEVVGAMALAGVVLWYGLVEPLHAATGESLSYVWAGTLFPILDAGVLCVAWLRWQNATDETFEITAKWLTLSMLAYGIANWINFSVRTVSPDADSLGTIAFWFLTEVFAAVAAWKFSRAASIRRSM
jgi:hypothetical protein